MCVFQLLHLCLLGEGPSLAPSACSGKAHRVPEVPEDQTSHLGFNPWLMGADASQLWRPPPPRGRLRRGSCTASQKPSVGRSASSPRSSKLAGKNPAFLLACSLAFLPLPLPCLVMLPKATAGRCLGPYLLAGHELDRARSSFLLLRSVSSSSTTAGNHGGTIQISI